MNADDLPGMWEHADLIGGETDSDALGHNRMVCCPDDPTCPWPDACDLCGQDWPCTFIRAARADERARLQRQRDAS